MDGGNYITANVYINVDIKTLRFKGGRGESGEERKMFVSFKCR